VRVPPTTIQLAIPDGADRKLTNREIKYAEYSMPYINRGRQAGIARAPQGKAYASGRR